MSRIRTSISIGKLNRTEKEDDLDGIVAAAQILDHHVMRGEDGKGEQREKGALEVHDETGPGFGCSECTMYPRRWQPEGDPIPGKGARDRRGPHHRQEGLNDDG